MRFSTSYTNLPCASLLSFIVLNLIMLNIFSFFPGRFWKKKGLPLLAIVRAIITNRKMGESTNSPIRATKKSNAGFTKDLYIYYLISYKNTQVWCYGQRLKGIIEEQPYLGNLNCVLYLFKMNYLSIFK